jgi:hypothetical protein
MVNFNVKKHTMYQEHLSQQIKSVELDIHSHLLISLSLPFSVECDKECDNRF